MSSSVSEPRVGADVVALTQWLCSVPSLIGEERTLCELLVARSKSWAIAGEVKRVGDSFAVALSEGTGGPKLTLAGHLDVVRTEHDGPTRLEGDRLYGAGAADMKSGLAAMIAVAEDAALRAHLKSRADVTLVFYAREEGPFAENELGPLLAAYELLRQQDLAICLEPSNNKLQLGCVGSLHATVTVHGRTSHSARPWQGDNAIQKSWSLLRDLDALQPVEVTIDGMLYRAVMSATLAHAGRGKNIIPDVFELNLNHRFLPTTTIDQAKRFVLDFVGDRADVEFIDESPSAPPHRSHPLVAKLTSAGVKAVEPKQAWTDVARFAQLGVPAVNWGPGEQAQAHQRNEWTGVEDLREGWEILRRFLASI
ncbi:MAG: succinyl-diaminopimelate desuccinylase [Polyangiales bacterium]